MSLKKTLSTALLMVASCSMTALAQGPAKAPVKAPFQVCKSTYALCTSARCEEIKILDTTLLFSCGCDVKTDEWSVGAHPCEPVKEVPEGQLIRSRYHPIKTYIRCSNNRPWAMCLDSPCIIDKNDKTKAKCTCSLVQNQGDYLVLPEDSDGCTNGIVSSATIDDLDAITDFLETQDKLLPHDFTVINTKQK